MDEIWCILESDASSKEADKSYAEERKEYPFSLFIGFASSSADVDHHKERGHAENHA